MHLIMSLLMAIAPSIALVWYFYKQDIEKPEPKRMVTRIFILGIFFTIPAIILEVLFDKICGLIIGDTILYDFIKAFIIAAFIEESIKLFVVNRFAYHHVHFDEVMDGIVYTIMASLGFACLENIIYAVECGLTIACVRAVTAVPMHALASGMMGYFIGKAKFAETKTDENSLILKGLWYAVLIHGIYDFFIFASPRIGDAFALGVFPLIIITFIILKHKIKSAIRDDFAAGRH